MTEIPLLLEREVTFQFGDTREKGKITLGGLERVSDRLWGCWYSISHISPERNRIYGEDPMDALANCIGFLSGLIQGSEDDGLKVWWQYAGDHCGLNLLPGGRPPEGFPADHP